MRRIQMINRAVDEYDLIVIGGGITGAGAARDAAMRGLKTLLVDMNDLAFGTSSRSSKLVHGGLRYLESAEFSLVFEAVSERRILMNIAPHLVNPQSFLFPVYGNSRRGVFTVNLGMWLYDGLSLFRSPKLHRNLSLKQLKKEEPLLMKKGLKGAPLYYDCSTDDARLVLENALSAIRFGADICTYTKAVGYQYDEAGRICGLELEDVLSAEKRVVKAAVVVNATGPWSDRTRHLKDDVADVRLRPTKGIHIVVDSQRLRLNNAVVCFHPEDGRVLFAIPWGDRTYIGTTDTDLIQDPSEIAATNEDVRYLLSVSNHYFPTAKLMPSDVISTWAGVRPLIMEENAENASAVSREHDVRIDNDGLITIAGGKLTTYRKMAAEVVDRAVEMLRLTGKNSKRFRSSKTADEALPGAVGWPSNDDHQVIIKGIMEEGEGRVSEETAALFCNTYGMRGFDLAQMIRRNPELAEPLVPGRPEVLAQVNFAVERELAATVTDVLERRTQLFFRDADQGLGCCERVGAQMANLMGWTDDQRDASVNDYRQNVQRSRDWRDD